MRWKRIEICLVVCCLSFLGAPCSVAAGQTTPQDHQQTLSAENEKIVREFVAAWSNLDADELVEYFAEDGTYYNMPTAPVSGHENLRKFIGAFLRHWDETEWEITNLLAQGEIVMVERVDRTIVAGKPVNLPCFGVFEMKNGKIVEWRDYFDLATFTKAVTE